MRSIRQGGKLIVVNPREIELARHADLHIQNRAGSDVALLMGMMRVIVDEGLHDPEFIEARCENFEAFRESLAQYDEATVEEKTGVPFAQIAEAARMYAQNSPASHPLRHGNHPAHPRNRQRAGHEQPRPADRQRRPALGRRESAARAEQRAGRVRHGGAPQRLPRLPEGGSSRGEGEVREGLGASSSTMLRA